MGYHRLRCTTLLTILVFLFLSWLLPAATFAARADDGEDARGFVDSMAAMIYGLAWPTATYQESLLKNVQRVAGGYDASVRLTGESAFGGELWLEIVIEVRNGALNDIRPGQHNAILSPPFATTRALGEAVAELIEQSSNQTLTSSGDPAGYRLHVTNNCRHAVELAIKYRDLTGTWRVVGWWTLNGVQSTYLAFQENNLLRTNSAVLFYYAKTKDGSLYWGGEHETVLDGEKLPMLRVEDVDGDTDWSLTCPGR